MTRAVTWSGPEAPKEAVLCKCCGDPAAHGALYFIRKNLPTMAVTFATPAGPWLTQIWLRGKAAACPAASWILEKALVWARVELEKSKGPLTRESAQEQVCFYRESFTAVWGVAAQGWPRGKGAADFPRTHFVPPASLLAGIRAGYGQRWTWWFWSFPLSLISDSLISSQFCTIVALNVKGRNLQCE